MANTNQITDDRSSVVIVMHNDTLYALSSSSPPPPPPYCKHAEFELINAGPPLQVYNQMDDEERERRQDNLCRLFLILVIILVFGIGTLIFLFTY